MSLSSRKSTENTTLLCVAVLSVKMFYILFVRALRRSSQFHSPLFEVTLYEEYIHDPNTVAYKHQRRQSFWQFNC